MMKGPQWNAKVAILNGKSDARLAAMVAQMRRSNAPRVKEQLIATVLRPFLHIVNEMEVEARHPSDLVDAIPSLAASMLVEVAARTVPVGTPPVIIEVYLKEFLRDVTDDLVRAFNAHYGPTFDTGEGAPVPAPPAGAH